MCVSLYLLDCEVSESLGLSNFMKNPTLANHSMSSVKDLVIKEEAPINENISTPVCCFISLIDNFMTCILFQLNIKRPTFLLGIHKPLEWTGTSYPVDSA